MIYPKQKLKVLKGISHKDLLCDILQNSNTHETEPRLWFKTNKQPYYPLVLKRTAGLKKHMWKLKKKKKGNAFNYDFNAAKFIGFF